MNRKFKALICSLIASVELISAGTSAAMVSYAAEESTEDTGYSDGTIPEEAETETAPDEEAAVTTTTTAAETTPVQTSTTTVTTETEDAAVTTTTSPGIIVEGETTTTTTAETAPETTTTTAATALEPEELSGWVTDENGRIYYYSESGTPLTGVCEIDGQKYVFAPNGVLKTGWRTIEGKRYYFDPATGEPQYGWVEYNGNNYYVSQSEGKRTGYFADSDGSSYIFDEYGLMYKGNTFVELDGRIYCAGEDGKLINEPAEIDGVPYVFASNGVLKTGWRTYDGKRYYYDPETGEMVTGLIEYSGKFYYVTAEDGKCSGIISIDGIDYVFNDVYGYMMTGWQNIDGAKHYYFEDGTAAVGFQTIAGGKYYFDETGVMQTGWIEIDGAEYYFAEDGKMASGWQEIDGLKYYFISGGQLAKGIIVIDGKTYAFGDDGSMLTGWYASGSFTYYFGPDGAAVTGWQQNVDGGKYYFDAEGKMLTGWQTIEGSNYYFYPETGLMAFDTEIDGYQIGPDGVAVKLSAVEKRADEIIASIGTSAQNIFNYVRSHNKYKYIEPTKTLEEIESVGWSYFADYAMDNRFVVCYYFAAVTDVIFRQAGYETRVVYGTGRGDGDHYWNQILVDGVWTNYDTCNGYADVTDDYLKSQNYTWKLYVYPEYN